MLESPIHKMDGLSSKLTDDPSSSSPQSRLKNDSSSNEFDSHPVKMQSSSSHRPLRSGDRKSLFLSKIAASLCLVLCSMSMLSPVSGASNSKSSSSKGERRVVCYYTNWSAYRQGPAKFLPDNINPYLCTHLVYAFGGLTSDSGIKPFDKYQDIDKGAYIIY